MGLLDRLKAAGRVAKAGAALEAGSGTDLVPVQAQSWRAVPPVMVASSHAQAMDLSRPFGPGMPLEPMDGYSGIPRAWDFPAGYNIVARPDRDNRVAFRTLKNLIDHYDIARMAIGHRIDDLRSLDWSIVAADGVTTDVTDAVNAAKKWLRKPDGTHSFRSWLAMYVEDVLRYDAGVLHKRRNRAGRVIGLDVVSGRTIAPVIDGYGRRPTGDAPAYVQYANGVPWQWFRAQDLVYEPYRPQADSPYGFAPLEAVLINANTDVRFQMHFLSYFTEGTVPEGFADAPEDISSPSQLQEWQEYWDALLLGDESAKHQIKWVPHGTTFTWPKHKEFDPEFPLYLMRKTCAAYHVTPNDLGFTEDVNRATGETQVEVQFRIGTLPLAQHLGGIITDVLQDDLGLPLVFSFDTGEQKDDRLQEAKTWQVHVQTGAAGIDEYRERLLGLPVDPANPVPRFVTTRTGLIPLSQIIATAGAGLDAETASPDLTPDETSLNAQVGAGIAPAPLQPITAGKAPETPAGPAVKAQDQPGQVKAAGVVVKADDTGRVLMLQRTLTPDDPAAGAWEFPGGCLEPGEDPAAAAVREWQEETGVLLPAGRTLSQWQHGVYQGFVHVIPSEADVIINVPDAGRQVLNPDDPDGDCPEVLAWWDLDDAAANPALRAELAEGRQEWLPLVADAWLTDGPAVRKALRQWRDNARSRVRAGKPPRLFVDIPGDVAGGIWAALDGAQTREDVDAAFRRVVKAGGVGPKGWRDVGRADVPQHAYDVRLTDYWAPKVQAALGALVPEAVIDAAARAAAAAVVKDEDQRDRIRQIALDSLADGVLTTTELEDVIRGLWADAWAAGSHAAAVQLDAAGVGGVFDGAVVGDWDAWTPGDPEAAALLRDGGLANLLDQAGVTVRGISGTSLDRLGNLIADAVAAGDSVDGLAGRLAGVLAGDTNRAVMIAHTETARAITDATLQTYRANGVRQWNWITTSGACVRCLEQEATSPHGLGDPAPPGHPLCRCAASPVPPPGL